MGFDAPAPISSSGPSPNSDRGVAGGVDATGIVSSEFWT